MEKLAIRLFGKKSSKCNDMQLLQSDGEATCYTRVDSTEKSGLEAHVAGPESEQSGRVAAAAKPATKPDAEADAGVQQKKKSAYVPTHAGSDFSSMPLPTTFRDSQAYERRHGNPDRRQSCPVVGGRASLQSYKHSSQLSQSSQSSQTSQTSQSSQLSTPASSSWSGFSASSLRSSRRESYRTITSDKHSASGGSRGSAAGERRYSLGRRVSEYIRPSLAQDPTEGINSLSMKRSAFYGLAD